MPNRLQRNLSRRLASPALAAVLLLALSSVDAVDAVDPASLTAGTFTTSEWGMEAFSLPAASLNAQQLAQFADGKAQFAGF
jgi:hypothetical protein